MKLLTILIAVLACASTLTTPSGKLTKLSQIFISNIPLVDSIAKDHVQVSRGQAKVNSL